MHLETISEAIVVKMAEQNIASTFSRYDIRVIIKFSTLLGKSALEIHKNLCEVLRNDAPCIKTVRKWVREVEDGRTDVADRGHDGRPAVVLCEETIEKVKAAVEEDKRRTCTELSEIVGVSKSTVHRILTDELGKKKVFAKWVPHLLTPEQKQARVQAAQGFLSRVEREGQHFLHRIITGDETWVFSFDPELKRQSAQWLDPGEPKPEKARRKQGAKKVMHIVFFDVKGIVLSWPVPVGVTVNGDYYRWVIKDKLRPALRKKRSGLLEEGVILHHDNAPVHKCTVVTELLEGYSWELLEHPPYSPDLAPCDFYLFPKLKERLRGCRFEDEDHIREAFKKELRSLDNGSLVTAFDRWIHRMDKCVQLNGAYVE